MLINKRQLAAVERRIMRFEKGKTDPFNGWTPPTRAELDARLRGDLGDAEFERVERERAERREALLEPEYWDSLPGWRVSALTRIGVRDPRKARGEPSRGGFARDR